MLESETPMQNCLTTPHGNLYLSSTRFVTLIPQLQATLCPLFLLNIQVVFHTLNSTENATAVI